MWSGGGSAASASARELAPLSTRIVSRPARRPPSMSEASRSPTIATRSAPGISARACSNRWRSGLPPISAVFPEAVSTAARIAPVPGQAPPGIGRVGSRLVAKRAAPPCRARVAVSSSS